MYGDLVGDVWLDGEELRGAALELARKAAAYRRKDDLTAAIATIDEALVLTGTADDFPTANLVRFLLAKAVWLAQEKRFDEALAICARAADLSEEDDLAVGRTRSPPGTRPHP